MQLKPPCHADPADWDQDPGREFTPHSPVHQLIHLCLTQCPALERCRALDKGDCFGVVAGRYRPWPDPSRLASMYQAGGAMRVAGAVRIEVEGLKPGTEIRTAAELAREHGVSKTTVGKALRWLAAEDVLVRPADHRKPYRVAARRHNQQHPAPPAPPAQAPNREDDAA